MANRSIRNDMRPIMPNVGLQRGPATLPGQTPMPAGNVGFQGRPQPMVGYAPPIQPLNGGMLTQGPAQVPAGVQAANPPPPTARVPTQAVIGQQMGQPGVGAPQPAQAPVMAAQPVLPTMNRR